MNGGGIPPGPTKVKITSLFDFTSYNYIVGREGANLGQKVTVSTNTLASSSYVNISRYSKLQISVVQMNDSTSDVGGCFYDKDRHPISGFWFADLAPKDNVVKEIDVPFGAVYVRTSRLRAGDYHNFSCYGIGVIV